MPIIKILIGDKEFVIHPPETAYRSIDELYKQVSKRIEDINNLMRTALNREELINAIARVVKNDPILAEVLIKVARESSVNNLIDFKIKVVRGRYKEGEELWGGKIAEILGCPVFLIPTGRDKGIYSFQLWTRASSDMIARADLDEFNERVRQGQIDANLIKEIKEEDLMRRINIAIFYLFYEVTNQLKEYFGASLRGLTPYQHPALSVRGIPGLWTKMDVSVEENTCWTQELVNAPIQKAEEVSINEEGEFTMIPYQESTHAGKVNELISHIEKSEDAKKFKEIDIPSHQISVNEIFVNILSEVMKSENNEKKINREKVDKKFIDTINELVKGHGEINMDTLTEALVNRYSSIGEIKDIEIPQNLISVFSYPKKNV